MNENTLQDDDFKKKLESYTKSNKVLIDVMTRLFLVFKESIEETNNDKRYFLEKLAFINKIGDAFAEHLKDLVNSMGDKDDGKDHKSCRQSWLISLKQHSIDLELIRDSAEANRTTINKIISQLED